MRVIVGRHIQRSIPACAGEAGGATAGVCLPKVYPRVCGGSHRQSPAQPFRGGLSPRVRGKPPARTAARYPRRSIPACAGEASAYPTGLTRCWVYPRVCGGSPANDPDNWYAPGLSPRVRGKHIEIQHRHLRAGSIPACAGEAPGGSVSPSVSPVYPRVCGGSSVVNALPEYKPGLSPRVRGKPVIAFAPLDVQRSIPACAGEARP